MGSKKSLGYHLLGDDRGRLFSFTTRRPQPDGTREALLSDAHGYHAHIFWREAAPGIVPSASRLKSPAGGHITQHRALSTETSVVARIRIGRDPVTGQQFGQILDPQSTQSTPPSWATTAISRKPIQLPGVGQPETLVDVVVMAQRPAPPPPMSDFVILEEVSSTGAWIGFRRSLR